MFWKHILIVHSVFLPRNIPCSGYITVFSFFYVLMGIWFSFEFLSAFTFLTQWITWMGFYIGKNARQNESMLNDAALCMQLKTMLINQQYQRAVHWTGRTVGWGEGREGAATKGHRKLRGKSTCSLSLWGNGFTDAYSCQNIQNCTL